MTYLELFNCAYMLCVRCNSHAIVHDLDCFNKAELLGVIIFLSQIVS